MIWIWHICDVDYSDNTKALLQKREVLYGRQAKRKDLEPEGNYRFILVTSQTFDEKRIEKKRKYYVNS